MKLNFENLYAVPKSPHKFIFVLCNYKYNLLEVQINISLIIFFFFYPLENILNGWMLNQLLQNYNILN